MREQGQRQQQGWNQQARLPSRGVLAAGGNGAEQKWRADHPEGSSPDLQAGMALPPPEQQVQAVGR